MIVHFSHHKAGTVLFKRALQVFCLATGRPGLAEARHGIPDPPAPDVVLVWNSGWGPPLAHALSRPDIRATHAIRDPRDVVVSAYHYHLKASEKWLHVPRADLGGSTYQAHLRTLPTDEGLVFEMDHRSQTTIADMLSWPGAHPAVLTIRLEEAMRAFDQTFEAVFAQWGLRGGALADAVAAMGRHDVGRMSPEALASNPHVHSGGVTGRWRLAFSPALCDAFDRRFPDAVARLGYA